MTERSHAKRRSEQGLDVLKEVDESGLAGIGDAVVTGIGSENIYFKADGRRYFCKVGNTEDYKMGKVNFKTVGSNGN